MVHRFVVKKVVSPLKDVLNTNTKKFAEEKQKIRSSLYASDYGQCLRKIWYQFYPEEYPQDQIEPRVLRIFHNGNDVHERLSTYFKMSPELDFHDEINVPRDELDVHGRCDGICRFEDQALVIEFKSINAKVVYNAKEEHIGQITWYMVMFRGLRHQLREDFGVQDGDVVSEADLDGMTALSGRTVEELNHVEKWLLFTQGELRGEIIYESKQNQELFHFPVDYDEGRVQKVRIWFEQLQYYVQTKIRPAVKYDRKKYPCSWAGGKCPYYDACYKDL